MTEPHEFLSHAADKRMEFVLRGDLKLKKPFEREEERPRSNECTEDAFQSIHVVPRLPLLRIKRTTLDFDNLMLFGGERFANCPFLLF